MSKTKGGGSTRNGGDSKSVEYEGTDAEAGVATNPSMAIVATATIIVMMRCLISPYLPNA